MKYFFKAWRTKRLYFSFWYTFFITLVIGRFHPWSLRHGSLRYLQSAIIKDSALAREATMPLWHEVFNMLCLLFSRQMWDQYRGYCFCCCLYCWSCCWCEVLSMFCLVFSMQMWDQDSGYCCCCCSYCCLYFCSCCWREVLSMFCLLFSMQVWDDDCLLKKCSNSVKCLNKRNRALSTALVVTYGHRVSSK